MTARRWVAAGLILAVLLLGGRATAAAVLELRWFESMGVAELWWARVSTTVALRAGCAAAAALFAFANLLAVRHSVVSLVLPRRVGNIEIGEEVPGRSLVLTAAALASALGLLLALPMDDWTTALLAFRGRPFEESDPYFQRDLGFFVHWLPFETSLYQWTLVTLAVVVGVVILLYALTPSLRWDGRTLYVSGYVRRHLTVLGGVLLLALAWSYRLDNYHLLLDGSGPGGAFTSIDHRVGIPGSLLLSLVSLAAAVVVMFAGWSGQIRIAFIAVTGVLLSAAAVRVVAPAVVGRESAARVATRELPYLGARASYSRRAFAVDRIVRPEARIEAATLAELSRVASVWDATAIEEALDPGAGEGGGDGRTVGWESGEARLEATLPVPVPDEEEGATWSAARVRAAEVDAAGDPVRAAAREHEAGASPASPLVVRPGANGHALVSDATGAVVGVPLRSRAARLVYGWALQDLRVAAGDESPQRLTLVLHRDVRARVRAIAPFFAQGERVTPIVIRDSLYWSVDLYAASRFYPLSQPVTMGETEWWYFHHAGVAVVQAQTGRTRILAVPDAEPLAASWRAIFPSLFASRQALPVTVMAALPPAAERLHVQATTFARYGSRLEGSTPRVVPVRDGADEQLAGDLTPFLSATGGTALSRPLLDAGDRVAGLLIATGGSQRGTYWQPLAPGGPRWPVVVERLRAATRAVPTSRQPVVRGPVRAIPVGGGVAFLQSSYTWREGRSPTLARVGLAIGDSVRADASLLALVGRAVADSARDAGSPTDLRGRVQALYDAMRAALRRGDLGAFGASFDSLGRALGRPVP